MASDVKGCIIKVIHNVVERKRAKQTIGLKLVQALSI